MTRPPSHITTLLSRHTRRRDLILAGGAASFVLDCLPGASAAYPAADNVARDGVLGDAPWPSLEGLQQGLHDLGYIEGENLRFEFRWARGQPELYPALAAELVGVPVDVIVTWGTPTVLAARGATGTIPIVMGGVGDPVAAGIVSSLAHPGGNITEFSSLSAELDPKRLEILKDLIPHLSCAVALSNPTNPICAIALRRLRPAAETLGVKLDVVELGEEGEIEEGFDAVRRARPEAVLVLADLFLLTSANGSPSS